MSTHAKLAPSAAHRWMRCPGSIALSSGIKDKSSTYADEGTQAHTYAAWLLRGAKPPVPPTDEEMVSYVSVYTAAVRRAATGNLLFVEQPIDISDWTGEEGAKGTADAVVVGAGFFEVHDLKYGMGHLVSAEHNEQLMVYALGVLDLVEQFSTGDVKEIKLVIHQPRRDHLSEWTLNREELIAFGDKVLLTAATAMACKPGEHLSPSAKACLWCPAKATCPALRAAVDKAVSEDFVVFNEGIPPDPATYPTPDLLGIVETWLSAVKTAIFEKLQAFQHVPGWKLVKGKEGNRKWKDEAAVEDLLKSLRVPRGDSHNLSLKSPAQMEKTELSPKKWQAVAEHITRNEAKPIMVGEDDPRAPIEQAKVEEFDVDIFA